MGRRKVDDDVEFFATKIEKEFATLDNLSIEFFELFGAAVARGLYTTFNGVDFCNHDFIEAINRGMTKEYTEKWYGPIFGK